MLDISPIVVVIALELVRWAVIRIILMLF